jgi:LmbE family N-acetylglucosaminyl deacetylase
MKLMCILAHPDDESLGTGSTLARYAAEGVETSLVTATRGERGWQGDPRADPGPRALGEMRTRELLAAARVLDLQHVEFLNYLDGELDQADPAEATARIVAHLRRLTPHVVVTFGPDGSYGHPDHIAISQLTSAAIVCSADARYVDPCGLPPHRVAKLYHLVNTRALVETYSSLLGEIAMTVDGLQRHPVAWEDWSITTHVDATPHWRTALRAARCHATQLGHFPDLETLPEAQQHVAWGMRSYYRAFSAVNGSRRVESDLFEGLR